MRIPYEACCISGSPLFPRTQPPMQLPVLLFRSQRPALDTARKILVNRRIPETRGVRIVSNMASNGEIPDVPRGAFILFEGVDNSGKSTQARILVDKLNERKVPTELWSFPDRKTELGKVINAYLAGTTDCDPTAIHLLFVANRMEKRRALLDKLRSGTTIVLDRYSYSGAAFTMAKQIPELNKQWCKAVERGQLPAPDLAFFLDLPIDQAKKREGFGGERYERSKFQERVRECYLDLMKDDVFWVQMDASRTIQDIHEEVLSRALEVVQDCKEGSNLHLLWE